METGNTRSKYMENWKINSYQAIIRDKGKNINEGDIYLSFRRIPIIENNTGTKITINFGENLCVNIINNIMWSIREIRDVPIKMTVEMSCFGQIRQSEIINYYDDKIRIPIDDAVNITIGNVIFIVEDKGTGISEDILFNIMLVPSISSKNRVIIGNNGVDYVNRTRLVQGDKGGLTITVNDILVYKGKIDCKDTYVHWS